MTQFETTDGRRLGARFAGDRGATFHMTQEEMATLWSLDESTECWSDGDWTGTSGELLDMWTAGHHATREEMERRGWTGATLHMTCTREMRATESGDLEETERWTR